MLEEQVFLPLSHLPRPHRWNSWFPPQQCIQLPVFSVTAGVPPSLCLEQFTSSSWLFNFLQFLIPTDRAALSVIPWNANLPSLTSFSIFTVSINHWIILADSGTYWHMYFMYQTTGDGDCWILCRMDRRDYQWLFKKRWHYSASCLTLWETDLKYLWLGMCHAKEIDISL